MVQVVAWALGGFQAALNVPFYSWQFGIARWLNHGVPWKYFNYIYFGEWALAIGAFLHVAPGVSGGRQLVIVVFTLWRTAEILTWYIKLLFDKGHRVFLEVERNLLFLVGDGLVFVTALTLLLETAREGGRWGKWSDAFSTFTLNGSPSGYHSSSWATAVGVLGTVGGLALLAAGLGIVIGIVSARIEEAQKEGRPYTGPTRPPLPRRKRVE